MWQSLTTSNQLSLLMHKEGCNFMSFRKLTNTQVRPDSTYSCQFSSCTLLIFVINVRQHVSLLSCLQVMLCKTAFHQVSVCVSMSSQASDGCVSSPFVLFIPFHYGTRCKTLCCCSDSSMCVCVYELFLLYVTFFRFKSTTKYESPVPEKDRSNKI